MEPPGCSSSITLEDEARIGRPGRLEQDAGVVAEGDDGDAVVPAEAIDEQAQRLLDELEPAFAFHGAGRVDDEGEGRILAGPVADLAGLEPDAKEDLVRRGERGRATVGDDREGLVLRAG